MDICRYNSYFINSLVHVDDKWQYKLLVDITTGNG